MDERRQRRMAHNEGVARRFNDMVEHAAENDDRAVERFICECVREDCAEPLDIELAEYARVRSHPRRFAVLAGHEEPAIESTVGAYSGYVVVQKRGEAGRIAEADAEL